MVEATGRVRLVVSTATDHIATEAAVAIQPMLLLGQLVGDS